MRRAARIGVALLLAGGAQAAAAQASDAAALRAEIEVLREQVRALSDQVRRLDRAEPPVPPPPAAVVAAAAPPPRSTVDEVPAELIFLDKNARLKHVPPAPIESALVPGKGRSAAFQITAGSGDGRAALRLARSRTIGASPLDRPASGGIRDAVVVDETISLTASSPLGDGDTAGFATLNKLADGQALNFRAAWFRGPVPLPDTIPAVYALKQKALGLCRAAAERAYRSAIGAGAGADADAVAAATRQRDVDVQLCTDDQDRAFWGRLDLDERLAREDAYAAGALRRSVVYGLNLGVGRKEFAYRDAGAFEDDDPSTFAKRSTAKFELSAGGFVGFFPASATAVTLGADYQRGFTAAKSRIACPVPAAGATVIRCTEGAFAPPEREEGLLLSGELRMAPLAGKLATGFLGRWAIAPRVEYDALSDDVAFDLPVFLVPDEDGNLVGGLRLGYSTAEKTVLGIFVGTSFDLNGK